MLTSERGIQKLNYQSSKPPPCSLDLFVLKKLLKILKEINQEEATAQIANIIKVPEQTDEAFEAYKNELRALYIINTQVYCQDGPSYISEDESIFDESQFPSKVKKIVFDNVMYYRVRFGYNPPYLIHVEFDFAKPSIFDFSSSPSYATNNTSVIELSGSGGRDTWIEGAHQGILKALQDNKKKRAWIHKANVYDFFLWIIFLPAVLINLFRFMSSHSDIFNKVPLSYQTAFYIYMFLLSIFMARIVYNYARWLFPFMELDTGTQKRNVIHRIILGTIILGLIISAIYDIAKKLLGI